MNKRWDVLGIGVAAVDDLVYVNHYPQPDEKIPVISKQRQGGGLTATALVTAARHGLRVAYCGRLGNDELSRFTLQDLQREGIDTSPTLLIPQAKPFHSIIIVDTLTGSRTILYSAEGVAEPDLEAITEEVVASSRVLFIDHLTYHSGLQAAKIAHTHGIPVVADMESVALPDLDWFLKHIDHLIVGIDIAHRLTGMSKPEDMVQAMAKYEMACFTVTDGARGCWYSERGGKAIHVPALSVEAVDTTGCGDVFHGAYAGALARGESVSRAVRLATITAGLKVEHPGGRTGIPGLERVERVMEEQYH
jgi:sulfofructose kinase